jgi:uroporphyrinogen-III decarboxylase
MPEASPQTPDAQNSSRFVRACLGHPVDRTPVWFLRQAGRYMPEYMAVRKHHTLLDICRTPTIAAEVTITAAERLGVDAAIIFADLLLPFTPMGLDFEFINGEGPVVHHPIRTLEQIQALRTDQTDDLRYVAQAIELVTKHFALKSPIFSASKETDSNASTKTTASKETDSNASTETAGSKGTDSNASTKTTASKETDSNASTETAASKETGSDTSMETVALKETGFDASTETVALKRTGSTASTETIALKGTGFSPSGQSALEKGALAPEGLPTEPQDQLGIIGFVGAPFTLASYMIEGGGSRNYIEAKKLMYSKSAAWPLLMEKLITVLVAYATQQVEAGADVIQVFDSWAGALSVADYRQYCLAPTTELIQRIQALGVPVIYFGVDTASLLPTFRETGADVLGLDWRVPLDVARKTLGPLAVQGNLDPITLFAPEDVIEARVKEILTLNAGRPGHIFNLGHGIVPGTPVENVINVARWVKQYSTPQK